MYCLGFELGLWGLDFGLALRLVGLGFGLWLQCDATQIVGSHSNERRSDGGVVVAGVRLSVLARRLPRLAAALVVLRLLLPQRAPAHRLSHGLGVAQLRLLFPAGGTRSDYRGQSSVMLCGRRARAGWFIPRSVGRIQ